MASTYNLTSDLLDRWMVSDTADRPAVLVEDRSWTYAELFELVGRVGNALRSASARRGDRVLLALPDSLELAASYLGILRVGCVAVLCNPVLRRPDFEMFLRESAPTVIIADASTGAELLPAIAATDDSARLVAAAGSLPRAVPWERWVGEGDPVCSPEPTTMEDPAFWLWTSGSTGHPRAAVHRHRDWIPCIAGYARGVLGMTSEDRCFTAAKTFHAYGLGNGIVFPLAVGASTAYLRGRPAPAAVFEAIERHRPSLFFGVPTMFAGLLAEAERAPFSRDLSSLRSCVSAGEPLPGELFRRWKNRFGIEVLDGIGSTEVLHIYLSARSGSVRPGSTGTPVAGYRCRVVDERGEPLPPGTIGDLWVDAPSLASGYAYRSQVAELRRRGEWFVSGDKFYVDGNGYYWYVGRADDMFKSHAEWVSPIVIEGVLIEHPAVLESAVVGASGRNGLVAPRAFVVLKTGASASPALAQELRSWVRERLPSHNVPQWVEFLAELPKSSTGKLLRYQLRRAAVADPT